MARYLALGLEFQLGADILSTAIAPSWDEIGKLAAIAVIRTGLNYFLMHAMKQERDAEEKRGHKSMQIDNFLFRSWTRVWRTFMIGVLAYVCLLLLLRISGKRTLSKMNAFDLVITVALDSILTRILSSKEPLRKRARHSEFYSKDVALIEGVTAFATLIGLQFIVAWLSVRSKVIRQWAKSEPALLL